MNEEEEERRSTEIKDWGSRGCYAGRPTSSWAGSISQLNRQFLRSLAHLAWDPVRGGLHKKAGSTLI